MQVANRFGKKAHIYPHYFQTSRSAPKTFFIALAFCVKKAIRND